MRLRRSDTLRFSGYSYCHHFASSFKQDGVAPNTVHLTNLFPDADLAKSALFVELDAGGILGEDPGLEGPKAVFLAFSYERL